MNIRLLHMKDQSRSLCGIHAKSILRFIKLNLLLLIHPNHLWVWFPSPLMILINLNHMLFAGLPELGRQLNSVQNDILNVVACILGQAKGLWEGIDFLVLQIEWLVFVVWVRHECLQRHKVGLEVLSNGVIVELLVVRVGEPDRALERDEVATLLHQVDNSLELDV